MESFAVIGLGRFGFRLATILTEAGAEVIAIDKDREIIEQIRDKVTVAVALDSTDELALRAQGVDKVDVAVVGIGTGFEASALTTIMLKELGVPKVIARAATGVRGQILSRIGADGIVNPERESAERWSSRLLAPAIMQQIELAEGHSLAQIPAPAAFFQKTLSQLDIRKKYQVNVVAIRRPVASDEPKKQPEIVISVPLPDTIILPKDILLLMGSNESIKAFPAD